MELIAEFFAEKHHFFPLKSFRFKCENMHRASNSFHLLLRIIFATQYLHLINAFNKTSEIKYSPQKFSSVQSAHWALLCADCALAAHSFNDQFNLAINNSLLCSLLKIRHFLIFSTVRICAWVHSVHTMISYDNNELPSKLVSVGNLRY